MASSSLIRPVERIRKLPVSTIVEDSLTVFWGDWLDLRVRIPQVAASGLVSPLIYILAFGLGLGSYIARIAETSAGSP